MISITESIDAGGSLLDSWLYQFQDADTLASLAGADFAFDPAEMSVNQILNLANQHINNIYDELEMDYPFGDVRDDEQFSFEYSENPEVLAENALSFFAHYDHLLQCMVNEISAGLNWLANLDPLDVSRADLKNFVVDFSVETFAGTPFENRMDLLLSEMGLD